MHLTPSAKALAVLQLRCLAIALGAAPFCGGVTAFSIVAGAVLSVSLLVILTLLAGLYFPARYRCCEVTVTEDIRVSRGVFFRRDHYFPADGTVFTQRADGPLCRRIGVCRITLFAVRRRLTLPLLETAQAQQLLEHIRAADRAVRIAQTVQTAQTADGKEPPSRDVSVL